VKYRPSPLPGIVKVAMVCGVVVWALSLCAEVCKAHLCASEGGTWGPRGTCEPPEVNVNQYRVIMPPSGLNPEIVPEKSGPAL
jgi:hypothetical protein